MTVKASTTNDRFDLHDVGLTHPDNNSFVKIDGSGRIYLMAGPNMGIVLDPVSQTVSLIGDTIKVVSKEDEGFKWNNVSFNPRAVSYAEPTFTYSKEVINHLYDDVDRFLQ